VPARPASSCVASGADDDQDRAVRELAAQAGIASWTIDRALIAADEFGDATPSAAAATRLQRQPVRAHRGAPTSSLFA